MKLLTTLFTATMLFISLISQAQMPGSGFFQRTITLKLLAGGIGNYGFVEGTGSQALFDYPYTATFDNAGNFYVADANNNAIRKVTSSGVVTLFAGNPSGNNGSSDGTGSAASFYYPTCIAVDSSNNLYVSDSLNDTIRKITPAGVVTTLAGTAGSTGTANGTGSAARFNNPTGIAVNSSGVIFVADANNNTIRQITSAGVVTTFAGTAGTAGFANGTGTAATFNGLGALAFDSTGNLFVADGGNNAIRKITTSAVVTTFAGLTSGASGSADGTGTAASFSLPSGLAFDSSGNLFVTDTNNATIRKITSSAVVTTVAGAVGSWGYVDGTGTAAQFNNPLYIGFDSSNNLYIADTKNNDLRKMTPAGVVTVFVGQAAPANNSNGTGVTAQFDSPVGISPDGSGNFYVADYNNNEIRKVTSAGVTTLFAGDPNGNSGRANATGSAATFNSPAGTAIDSSGNIFVADQSNNEIRKITSAAVVTLFAGSTTGASGRTNATGTSAKFKAPQGMVIDSSNNIYLCDTGNNEIRKITSAGVVTLFAGNSSGTAGYTNGTGTGASFSTPLNIVMDSSGNFYVTDTLNNAIRKITSSGAVTTFAGSATGVGGSTDGTGTAALFNGPTGIAIDSYNNLYVTDDNNYTIRRITSAGVVTTLAGVAGQNYPLLGPIPSTLASMQQLTVYNGILYALLNNAIVYFNLP